MALNFALASHATWRANFRDLGSAVTRIATLATSGRSDEILAREKTARLSAQWQPPPTASDDLLVHILGPKAAELDLFYHIQLAEVVRICRHAASLSDAGRTLFAISRQARKTANDADRLQKYLACFNLDWDGVRRT